MRGTRHVERFRAARLRSAVIVLAGRFGFDLTAASEPVTLSVGHRLDWPEPVHGPAQAGAARNQTDMRSFQAQRGVPADAVTTETLSGGHYSAWTASWTGPPTGEIGHGPQTDVDYMAQVGTAVTFVGFDLPGLNDAIPDHAAAQAILSAITQHLSVYASGS